MPDPLADTPESRRNFWQRRVRDPIVAQLTQGITPEKIALTLSVGSGLANFPILGTTSALCFFVGFKLKLNQPIIQVVNYLCTPIHIPFIIYSFKWGEKLFGVKHTRVEIRSMARLLMDDPVKFLHDFGTAAFHACIVWAILVPFWMLAVYYIALPIMRAIARVRLEAAAKAAVEKSADHPVP